MESSRPKHLMLRYLRSFGGVVALLYVPGLLFLMGEGLFGKWDFLIYPGLGIYIVLHEFLPWRLGGESLEGTMFIAITLVLIISGTLLLAQGRWWAVGVGFALVVVSFVSGGLVEALMSI